MKKLFQTAVILLAVLFCTSAYADLTLTGNAQTIVTTSPSPDVQAIIGAADNAAIRALVDLEAGTDFYSKSATDSLLDAKQGVLAEGAFVDTDKTKLDGIESSADVTDATNVTAAGARMDSEYTSAALTVDDDPEQITITAGSWVDERVVTGAADGYEIELLETGAATGEIIRIVNADDADIYHIDDVSGNVENPDDKTVYLSPGDTASWIYVTDRWYHMSGGSYDIVVGSIEVGSMAHFENADMLYAGNAGGTPYTLTHSEVSGRILTNYGLAGDAVYLFPAATGGENGIFQIGAAYQVNLTPPTDQKFWLNGTEMAANEDIINAADTEGEAIAWWVVEVSDGVYEYHFESKYSTWAEASP